MFKFFRQRMIVSVYLSKVPEKISVTPGTNTKELADSTIEKYQDLIARLLEYFGEDRLVETITRGEYAACHEWFANRGTAATTCNLYRRMLRAAWNKLKERGYDVCDIDGIFRVEPQPDQQSRAIHENHMLAMLQLANIRNAAIILYAESSGIRRQTIPRLRIDNTLVWLAGDSRYRIASRIPREKTSAPRLIMGDETAAIAVKLWLETRYHRDSPWLFCEANTGEQLQVGTVSTIMRNLRVAANIPAWSNAGWHGLRHRFCQQKLTDHDQKIVAQWMGISIETMLKVYAHRDEEILLKERFGDNGFPAELLRR